MKKNLWKRRLAGLCTGALLLTSMAVPALAVDTDPAAVESEQGVLTYTEIIAPQYEDAQTFSEGLAAVKQGGKWGFIDETGKVVIPFQYDYVGRFSEGRALVLTSQIVKNYDGSDWEIFLLGSVDKTGAYTPFYMPYGDYAYDYEGQVEVKGDLIRAYVEEYDFDSDYPYIYYNGYLLVDQVMYDKDGMPLVGSDGRVYFFSWQMTEGMAAAWPEASGQMVYVNADGEVVLDTPYEAWDYRPFNQGMAVAGASTDEGNTIYGIIDKNGNWVIEPSFSNFYVMGYNAAYQVFDEMGYLMVEKNGKWGAVDKNNNVKIPFEYDGLMPSQEGRIAYNVAGKWGFLDSWTLEPVVAPTYLYATSYNGGIAVVSDGKTAKLIDQQGQMIAGADQIAPSAYFTIDEFDNVAVMTPGDYVTIVAGGKYGFGKVAYEPALPQQSEMSSWAYEEVCAAIEADLVPVYLRNLYQANITRDDFADTIVQAMEAISGKDVETMVQEATGKSLDEAVASYPFVDSVNENVIAANALGVISGYGDGVFLPNNQITRQEAASMLMRAAKALGADVDDAAAAGFSDQAQVAEWAQASVNYVYQAGIMSGTGNNAFSPLNNYTREQTFMTVYRLLKAMVA